MTRFFTTRLVWGMAGFMWLACSALWAAQLNSLAGLSINAGMAGSWANAAIPGQGLFIDVDPSTRTVFLAWFTYAEAQSGTEAIIGNESNRWYVAVGNYEDAGNQVELSLIETDGGIFDQPGDVSETEIGSLILRFTTCEEASMDFSFIDGRASGNVELMRLTSAEVCESLTDP